MTTPNDRIVHTLKMHTVFVYPVAHCVHLVFVEYFISLIFYFNIRLLKLDEAAHRDSGKHVLTKPT